MSASQMVIGGGNLCRIQALTRTVAANGTVSYAIASGTGSKMDFNLTIQTQIAKNEDGTYTFTIDNAINSPELDTFLDTYAGAAASSNTEELTFEDGSTFGGATAGSKEMLIIVYGGKNGETTPKRKVFVGVGRIASTAGSFTQTANTYNRIEIVVTTFKSEALLDNPVIGPVLAQPSLIGVTTGPTVPVGSTGKWHWISTATP